MFLLRNSFRKSTKVFAYITFSINQEPQRQIHRWVSPTLRELKRRRDKVGPEKPFARSSFLEWNYEAEIYAFGKRLGENFNKDILKRALTHKSYIIQKELEGETTDLQSNQDLIEEGSLIISECLNEEYGKIYVKDIADSIIKHLTTEDMLSHVAKHLGLTDLVLTSELPVEKSTLANTFKAVIAALKQSQDLERAKKFIKDFLIVQLNGQTVFDLWEPEEPIEYLNNILKKKGIEQFEARLCNESASNTILANYQVGLYSNKKLLGIGWGENVEIAKNTAALDAIRRMYKLRTVLI
ncbi:hypothetical protein HHI36_021442 [Cryptolaemus montrouzieri]|uniref:Large ribosomal subunit protein mL44 n=1 Tax=Cryptolaemus montrouzieri TaxID=559131 RepID=A0ABD2MXL3_9CUCU